MVTDNQIKIKHTKRAWDCILLWRYINKRPRTFEQVIKYGNDKLNLSGNKDECIVNMLRRLKRLGCLESEQGHSNGKKTSTVYRTKLEPVIAVVISNSHPVDG